MQGEEAYFKAVAAKHRYVTLSTLTQMSKTRESKIKKEKSAFQARSKSQVPISRSNSRQNPTQASSSSPEQPRRSMIHRASSVQEIRRENKPQLSVARYSSLSNPDKPLALLDVEMQLKNKEKDIEHLQRNLQRLSVLTPASP